MLFPSIFVKLKPPKHSGMQKDVSIKIQELAAGNRKVYQHIFNTFYHLLCLFTHRFIDDLLICEDCVRKRFRTVFSELVFIGYSDGRKPGALQGWR